MKHFFQILLCCLCLHQEAGAQRNLRNNVYGEAFGFAGYYSVNYERFQPLTKNRLLLVGLNTGFSFWKYDYTRSFAIPTGLKVCIGWKGIYGEFGGNYLVIRQKSRDYLRGGWIKDKSKFKLFHFGIRYQPEEGRIFLRGFVFPVRTSGGNGLILRYYNKPPGNVLRQKGITHVWYGGIDIGYSF